MAKARIAVINESASRHFFDGRDPVGSVVNVNEREFQIVGVVRDSKHSDIRQDAERFIYISFRQPYDRNFQMTLSFRSTQELETQIAAVQRLVRGLGADVLVTDTRTFTQQVEESLLQDRLISCGGGNMLPPFRQTRSMPPGSPRILMLPRKHRGSSLDLALRWPTWLLTAAAVSASCTGRG